MEKRDKRKAANINYRDLNKNGINAMVPDFAHGDESDGVAANDISQTYPRSSRRLASAAKNHDAMFETPRHQNIHEGNYPQTTGGRAGLNSHISP
jgi:hypothetical protein